MKYTLQRHPPRDNSTTKASIVSGNALTEIPRMCFPNVLRFSSINQVATIVQGGFYLTTVLRETVHRISSLDTGSHWTLTDTVPVDKAEYVKNSNQIALTVI